MQRLKLRALNLGANEVLSRAQLKNVLGGVGSGNWSCYCYCADDEQNGTWNDECTCNDSPACCCGPAYDRANCSGC